MWMLRRVTHPNFMWDPLHNGLQNIHTNTCVTCNRHLNIYTCMDICMYIHTYVCMYVCMFVWVCLYIEREREMDIDKSICMCIQNKTYMQTYMCVLIYTHTYIHYIYMHTHTYVYVYAYICIHFSIDCKPSPELLHQFFTSTFFLFLLFIRIQLVVHSLVTGPKHSTNLFLLPLLYARTIWK